MADNSFTHLVVVGSSAGGIGALSGLVSSLPEDFDAPIVVEVGLERLVRRGQEPRGGAARKGAGRVAGP